MVRPLYNSLGSDPIMPRQGNTASSIVRFQIVRLSETNLTLPRSAQSVCCLHYSPGANKTTLSLCWIPFEHWKWYWGCGWKKSVSKTNQLSKLPFLPVSSDSPQQKKEQKWNCVANVGKKPEARSVV